MDIDIIGMAINLGANRLGVEKGFSTLNNKLSFPLIFKGHNIHICREILCPSFDELGDTDSIMKNKNAIFEGDSKLADEVNKSLSRGHFPLIIGGDHSLSWGSISGVTKIYPDLGCVYVDAHGDFNLAECSPSHNVHGMHMAYLMGLSSSELNDFYYPGIKLDKKDVFFVGTRSLDQGEKNFAERYKLNIQTSDDIRKNGVNRIVDNLLLKIEQSGIEHFHLSFDLDVIDPEIAPGTGVPELNGIALDDAVVIIGRLLKTGKFVSMDLVEFNPTLDIENKTLEVCRKLLKQISENL